MTTLSKVVLLHLSKIPHLIYAWGQHAEITSRLFINMGCDYSRGSYDPFRSVRILEYRNGEDTQYARLVLNCVH
jgi:hypothetical protein